MGSNGNRNRNILIAAIALAAGALAALESAPAPARLLIADSQSLTGRRSPASEGQAWKTFKIRGKPVVFHRFVARNLVVSRSCLRADGAPECDAVRAVARATMKKVRESVAPYQAGRDICVLLGGEPDVGETEDGDESQFCLFRDGSWIGGESLVQHAAENDKLSR